MLHLIILLSVVSLAFAETSVIIIGAGASGIAAAVKLLENSITNITILEAEDRIGGRIFTAEMANETIDLGAQFVFGEEGNAVNAISKEFDVLEPFVEIPQSNIFFSDGEKMDEDVAADYKQIVFSCYVDKSKRSEKPTGKSLEKVLAETYSGIVQRYENNTEKHIIYKQGLRFLKNSMLLYEGAYSLDEIAAEHDYVDLKGHVQYFKNGYKTILDILTKKYPNATNQLNLETNIFLKTKVTQINWKENGGATVLTEHNTSYSANFVIFTPSLGVLKHENIFNPELPSHKKEAINALTFNGTAKIFLSFQDKWWTNETAFNFFWKEEDVKSVEDPTWILQISRLIRLGSKSNIWIAEVVGSLVPEVERQPLDVLKKGVRYVLDKFLGKTYNITEINEIMKTSWSQQENFRGGLLNVKAGFYDKDVSHQRTLSEPLLRSDGSQVLLFAGDATHPYFYSTVHGAIETGFREAKRIIKDCKNQKTEFLR